MENATDGLDKKLITGEDFQDIAEAFDKEKHDGLIYEMDEIGYPNLAQLKASYLERQKFRVKIGNETSTFRGQEAGVPQGTTHWIPQ